uniref:Uncharacterized protein n=1 Tax=Palpitomonas bilix TaxID=652834 RepID=A0A7S3DDF7_9EUKA|mmetsp:Transcript_32172/g.83644  ORF Transcript_32172/g.83644 Transcript_32172/m.83644 type:complete len:149 (+) Transcript_32172:106-552(+)
MSASVEKKPAVDGSPHRSDTSSLRRRRRSTNEEPQPPDWFDFFSSSDEDEYMSQRMREEKRRRRRALQSGGSSAFQLFRPAIINYTVNQDEQLLGAAREENESEGRKRVVCQEKTPLLDRPAATDRDHQPVPSPSSKRWAKAKRAVGF